MGALDDDGTTDVGANVVGSAVGADVAAGTGDGDGVVTSEVEGKSVVGARVAGSAVVASRVVGASVGTLVVGSAVVGASVSSFGTADVFERRIHRGFEALVRLLSEHMHEAPSDGTTEHTSAATVFTFGAKQSTEALQEDVEQELEFPKSTTVTNGLGRPSTDPLAPFRLLQRSKKARPSGRGELDRTTVPLFHSAIGPNEVLLQTFSSNDTYEAANNTIGHCTSTQEATVGWTCWFSKTNVFPARLHQDC